MKKNTTMRIATILVVLTLITSCFVGGTFAKYVSAGTGSDNARVAKWGVTVTGEADMFKEKYAKDDESFTLAGETVVTSVEGEKLVAPGTKGGLVNFKLAGTPEVAVRLSYAVESFDIANWVDAENNFYCPIVIKLTVGEGATAVVHTVCGLDYATEEAFEAAVIAMVAAKAPTQDFEALTNLATVTNASLNLTWEWEFENRTGSETVQNDVKDTFLGDRAAAGNAATIAIDVAATATQID